MPSDAKAHTERLARFARIIQLCKEREVFPATRLYKRVRDLALNSDDKRIRAIYSWSDDLFRKNLKRGHSLTNECIDLISEIFASSDPSELPQSDKTAIYRRRIWDAEALSETGLARPAVPLTGLPHAFKRVVVPPRGRGDPEAFYNAAYDGLCSIVDDYDVERSVYTTDGNLLLEEILQFTKYGRGLSCFFVQGKAGSGKTTFLNRIAVTLNKSLCQVYFYEYCFLSSDQIMSDVINIRNSLAEPVVLIFDDQFRTRSKGFDLSYVLRGLRQTYIDNPLALIFSDNWFIRRGFSPLDKGCLKSSDRLAHLNELSLEEVEILLSKLVFAERAGLIKKIPRDIVKSDRLKYVSSLKDRLVAYALLKLRYCKAITDILRDEYDSLEEEGPRAFYREVAILTALDVTTPSFMANRRWAGLHSDFPIGRFLKMFFKEERGEYTLRHRIIVWPLISVLFSDVDSRPIRLGELLSSLDLSRNADRNFAIGFLTSEGICRRIYHFLERGSPRVLTLINYLRDKDEYFEKHCLGSVLHAFIGTFYKDILLEFDNAEIAFELAYAQDPDDPYILRQRAWLALRQSRFELAEERAREAVEAWPNDPATVSHCAFVLSWCSRPGFEFAGELYRTLEPDSMTREGLRQWDRYQEAATLLAHMGGDVTSESFLKALAAPSFVWRARSHARKLVGRALFKELASNLASNDALPLDPDVIDVEQNEFVDHGFFNDGKLRGLLKGNLARQEYEKWRDFKDPLDIEALDLLFKEATKLAPDEPFTLCWYGTFLKEVREDYKGARNAYEKARSIAKSSKVQWIKYHPMFENNLALLIMDGVYRQLYRSSELKIAYRHLCASIQAMETSDSQFKWPLAGMELLRAQAREFGEVLP